MNTEPFGTRTIISPNLQISKTEFQVLGDVLSDENIFPHGSFADLERTDMGTLVANVTFYADDDSCKGNILPDVAILIRDHHFEIIDYNH